MKKEKPIKVTSAEYNGGLSLLIRFSDGTERVVDFSGFLREHPHPQHDKYAIPANFRKFTLRFGNVIWGKNADLCFPVHALYIGDLNYWE